MCCEPAIHSCCRFARSRVRIFCPQARPAKPRHVYRCSNWCEYKAYALKRVYGENGREATTTKSQSVARVREPPSKRNKTISGIPRQSKIPKPASGTWPDVIPAKVEIPKRYQLRNLDDPTASREFETIEGRYKEANIYWEQQNNNLRDDLNKARAKAEEYRMRHKYGLKYLVGAEDKRCHYSSRKC